MTEKLQIMAFFLQACRKALFHVEWYLYRNYKEVSSMEKIKPFEELTFLDNFMFQCVLRNKRICKYMIEKILKISIQDLHYQDYEKTINLGLVSKGIRLDVYVEDKEGRVYDIEMQCTNAPNNGLAKRSRFYQSMIDMELLGKGENYEKLNPSYVIFICTFDPFGVNLPIYTFTHCCEEDNTVKLNDEETRVFLNSKGSENTADPDIAAFLRYIDGKAPEGDFARTVDQEVQRVKGLEKVRREYMILSDEIRRRQEEARIEGIEQEKNSNILGMLRENIPMETIARITKVSVEQIRELGKLNGVL